MKYTFYINYCPMCGRKSIKHWVKALQKENEEKDKQIDIMVRAFRQDDVRSVEEIKQYFEKLARRII